MKCRESNFELLRIIAMLMVVVGHVCGVNFHPEVNAPISPLSDPLSVFSRMFLGRCCGVAVDVFILISGYFSIKPKLKSILNFFYLVFFWRFLMVGIQIAFGYDAFSLKGFVFAVNPLDIWFIREYLTLMLVAPLLNVFCEKVPREGLLRYVVLFYGVAFIADFVVPIKFWGIFGGGYTVLWFMELYLIGRYIRLYGLGCFEFSRRKDLLLYVLIALCGAILLFVTRSVTNVRIVVGRMECFVGYYTSPFVLAGAIAIFQVFRKISISSLLVNHLALSVFAIYLAHSPTRWFRTSIRQAYNSSGIVSVILIIVGVFVGTILLDQVRIYSWRLLQKCFARD